MLIRGNYMLNTWILSFPPKDEKITLRLHIKHTIFSKFNFHIMRINIHEFPGSYHKGTV